MKQFEEIWNEYYPKLTVYLRTSFCFRDTDDLVQEIMIKIHSNMHIYKPALSTSAWIYSIARNHAVDALRRESSRLRILERVKQEAAVTAGISAGSGDKLLKEELKADIADFISSLPETERQISFLKYYEEMNYREISRITEIPQGTIKYHMHNIRKKFARYYGDRYED